MSSKKSIYLINSPFGPPIVTTTASSALYNVITPTCNCYNNYITIDGKECNYGLRLKNEDNIYPKNYFDKYLDKFNECAYDFDEFVLVLEIPSTPEDVEDLITDEDSPNNTSFKKYQKSELLNDIKKSALIFKNSTNHQPVNNPNSKDEELTDSKIGYLIYFDYIKLTKDSNNLYSIASDHMMNDKYIAYENKNTGIPEDFSVSFKKTDNGNKYMEVEYIYNPAADVDIVGMTLKKPKFVGGDTTNEK